MSNEEELFTATTESPWGKSATGAEIIASILKAKEELPPLPAPQTRVWNFYRSDPEILFVVLEVFIDSPTLESLLRDGWMRSRLEDLLVFSQLKEPSPYVKVRKTFLGPCDLLDQAETKLREALW